MSTRRSATRIGLPFSKPYLNASADFRTGVNYAVSGATAQNASYLHSKLITPLTEISLDVQINWHLTLKSMTQDPNMPSNSSYKTGLYVVEIGGNDYISALTSFLYTPSYVTTNFIPLVIAKIKNATEVLYANGARNFLYIGVTPLGCSSSLLATFLLGPKDSNGCLSDINTLSYNHALSLSRLVNQLRLHYTDAKFTFLDYYAAYKKVIGNSSKYGFSNTLETCCGAGPAFPYRYNQALFCSTLSSTLLSTLCPNPNAFVNWDGLHFTHKFNSVIFNLTINGGSYLNPPKAFSTCMPSM
ncbi:hypothetical protein KP509_10G078300 [Ceratopteris richardii]|uniref:Uncharacterized protein n=1 Tax=Ceratopteris richardii TaxID=49495 RepID=A0A8T2U3P5_CERRI|nr:hypothetical protein KP509_10G078300 [Ceratopteris richardii]